MSRVSNTNKYSSKVHFPQENALIRHLPNEKPPFKCLDRDLPSIRSKQLGLK